MTTQDIQNLKRALRDDPLDDLTYLALADALDEVGRHAEAARYRAGKPSIPDVIRHFVPYAKKYADWEWGGLHVILSENNVENATVVWLWDYTRGGGEGEDSEVHHLVRILLRMSKTQRSRIGEMRVSADGEVTLPAKAHVHVKGISGFAPAIDYGRQRKAVTP